MMMILAILLLAIFGASVFYWPEYSAMWALINTIAFYANVTVTGTESIEDVWASILGWFLAPVLYFTGE